jgi:hypothetical protein
MEPRSTTLFLDVQCIMGIYIITSGTRYESLLALNALIKIYQSQCVHRAYPAPLRGPLLQPSQV